MTLVGGGLLLVAFTYRSSSQEYKAEECEILQATSLCCSSAKSTLIVLLTFIKLETTPESVNFCSAFLSFFLFHHAKLKNYRIAGNFRTDLIFVHELEDENYIYENLIVRNFSPDVIFAATRFKPNERI